MIRPTIKITLAPIQSKKYRVGNPASIQCQITYTPGPITFVRKSKINVKNEPILSEINLKALIHNIMYIAALGIIKSHPKIRKYIFI